MNTLILGGVRSGKSRLAENLAQRSALRVIYIATAHSGDAEMQARISSHRERRPPQWQTIEESLALAKVIRQHAAPDTCLLVDCLTLWLTNLLCANDEKQLRREREALIECLPELPGKILIVSNETGLGVVPLGELSRRYTDEVGALHQRLAERCEQVIFTIAGLPQILKGESV